MTVGVFVNVLSQNVYVIGVAADERIDVSADGRNNGGDNAGIGNGTADGVD